MKPLARCKALLLVALACCAAGAAPMWGASPAYPDRWVYVSTNLASDSELERVAGIARTASEHGLNGMLLSAGFDSLDLKSPQFLARLERLKSTCDAAGLEIIPLGFSVGYGSGVMAHDRNLAAGQPVRGALFLAGKREARFLSDRAVTIANGGFERAEGGLPAGFTAQGRRAALDRQVFHSGHASLRLDDFSGPEGSVYVAQSVRVQPYRSYRLRAWVKTEGAGPQMLIHLVAQASDGRPLSFMELPLAATSDWHELTWGFNSWYADRVEIRAGVSQGKHGRVWIDDLTLEEVGLANVLRRPGTPLAVRNEKTGEVYQEGRDFAPLRDLQLDFTWNHDGPSIQLLPGSRIQAGDRLRVDYFHGTTIYRDQVVLDMSEPAVYEIWRRQLPLIEKYLSPRKYFLSMDEVRVGGFCEACRSRHLSMAALLGDCLARQYQMIRAANPGAQVYVWSDMFDPNHNARDQYYLIDGSFEGTWKYLPKDLIVACWYFEKRDLSLGFFSSLGYRTLAGAYYDADDLKNPQAWLESLRRTRGAVGIMYTTWENKYQLLPAFGDLLAK